MANVYYHFKDGSTIDSGSVGGMEALQEDALKPLKKYARKCSHCGRLFNEGYVIEGGEAYYCSNGCLEQNMTLKQYAELYEDGNGETYFTTWEDEDDFLYYENGDEVI